MYQVDDAPLETLHIYLERAQPPRPSLLPAFLFVFVLALVIAMSVLVPYQPPVVRTVIRVPAVLSTVRTFTAHVSVVPTGTMAYPATTAHGTLTITNGSVIAQTLPAGVIFITNSSVSIATDQAVFIPAGNANGYGYATVTAHALLRGRAGNIPALAVDTVEGSSVYVRNLTAFHGGHDASSVTYVTAHDTQRAVRTAHHLLEAQASGLHYPCFETRRSAVVVTWRCQFLTYHLPPNMHVSGVTIVGKNLVLAVWFIAPSVPICVRCQPVRL